MFPFPQNATFTPANLFRAALAGLLATAWSALLLAELGYFHAGAALLAGTGTILWFLRHPDPAPTGWAWPDAAALLLAFGSLLLTLPPHLYLLGGWDPGVYVHTASALNRYGTLQFPEADLCALSGEARALLTRDLHGIVEPFLGMRVVDGRYVSPQFYHLFPSLMALLWPLGGPSAALLLNPLLNMFALMAFYAVLRKLLPPAAALLGLTMLLLHPAQIWQARFPSAEMLTQTLLWSGFALLLRADDEGPWSRRNALLAGCALGAAQLARYDTLMVLSPLAAVLLISLLWHPARRPALFILLPISLLALHAWLHQKWVAPFYAPISSVVHQAFAGLTVVALALLVVAAFPKGRLGLRTLFSAASPRWLPILLLAAWWTFGLTIRPDLPDESGAARFTASLFSQLGLPDLAQQLAGKDAAIGDYLRALWGLPALLAAMAGSLLLIYRQRSRMATAWLAACLAVVLVLTYKIYNDHFLMWLSRRFIPIVVPFFTAGFAFFCYHVTRRLPRYATGAAAALALILLAPRFPAARDMVHLHDWHGLDTWLEQSAAHLPAGSTLLSDQAGFAAAFRYLHAINAYELNQRQPNAFPRLMDYLRSQPATNPVYFLTRRFETEAPPAAWALVAPLPLKTGRMEHSRFDVPSTLKPRGGPFALYRWNPSAEPAILAP